MRFSEYEKIENKKQVHKKNDWVSDFDFDVAYLVSEARLRSGLTQTQLAKLIHTKQPSIARAENGSSLPSLSFLKKIAIAIGTTLTPPQFGFMPEINGSYVLSHVKEEIKYVPIFIEAHRSSQESSVVILSN